MSPSSKSSGSGCTPFSVSVAVLTPDDKTQINFGLTKGCNPDDTAFWIVDFILKELSGGTMKTRIEIHVHVGKELEQDAATLAKTKALSRENIDLLQTKGAKRAKQLPAGTTSDKKLNNIVLAAVQN